MLDRTFAFVCDMLEATCRPEPQEGAAPTGPLWDLRVPHARQIVPFIRDYAKFGESARIDVNGRHLATLKLNGEPMVSESAASVPYARKLFDATVQAATAVIPFSCHPKAESLLRGEWTEFGKVKIRLGSLVPRVMWEPSKLWDGHDAVIRWETSPGARAFGPMGWKEWSAQIPEIRIGEFKGRVIFSRNWMTFGAPDLEWA
jgi:hypothetical protein